MQTDHSDHSSSTIVEISAEGVEPPSWADPLAGFATRVLEHLGLGGRELSILLCDEAVIRRLNSDYRRIDAATDVLSFGVDEEESPGAAEVRFLGDIAVALPFVQRQAAQLGVPEEEELRRMVVHGILHLAGYEHGDDTMETKENSPMLSLQERILEELSEDRLF